MIIGLLRERKQDERRVAMRPDQVAELVRAGHEVIVESGAGAGAGYSDSEYAGARIADRQELYDRARLLVKVKAPEVSEIDFLRPQHVLFTFLHFDENIPPERIHRIVNTGVTGVAFEWVEVHGRFPILQPMSEITGRLFGFKALALLLEHAGTFGGPGTPDTRAMVIGAGHIGANAIDVLLRNGAAVTVVDKHPGTLPARIMKYMPEPLWSALRERVSVLAFEERDPATSAAAVARASRDMSIVICSAVRRPSLPKSACEFLLDRQAVAAMRRGSIVCDATACDQDFIETAVSSSSLTEFYEEEGVVHYNCDHIPSLAPRTATEMLSAAAFPYVQKLANGFEQAVVGDEALYKAVMCHKRALTHPYSARKKGLPFVELNTLLDRG